MNFGGNIKFLRQRKKRTQDEAATAMDMKRSTLSGYENGIAQPNIEALLQFSSYYKVPLDVLLKTDLTILSEKQLTEIELGSELYASGQQLRVLATTVDRHDRENVELVTEKAKAGYATGFADPEYVENLPVFYLPFLSKDRKYRTFQISGDSMLPIPDGSYVTGEYVVDWNQIKDGYGYIILTKEDGIVFKLVTKQIKEQRTLLLKSLNPLYDPYEIPINQVKEVWKFTHYISNQMPEAALPQDEIVSTLLKLQGDMAKLKIAVNI